MRFHLHHPGKTTLGMTLGQSVDDLIKQMEEQCDSLLEQIQEEALHEGRRYLGVGDKARRHAESRKDPKSIERKRYGHVFNTLGEIQQASRVNGLANAYNIARSLCDYLIEMRERSTESEELPELESAGDSGLFQAPPPVRSKKAKSAKKGKKT